MNNITSAEVERVPVTVPTFVGLDLSLTSTGVCVKTGSDIKVYTVCTNPRTAPNDLLRLEFIRDKVVGLIPASTVMVCVEDWFIPHNPAQTSAAMGLIQVGTLIRLALLHRGLPFFIPANTQLKKFILGKGIGDKNLVVREVYKRWNVNVKDDNQADGCVLSHMAEAIYYARAGNGLGNLAKYQVEVVQKVMKERPRYNI